VSDELAELHRFNAWANRSLLAALRLLGAEQLTERRGGMYGSVLSVLGHLTEVEYVYWRMIRGETREEIERMIRRGGAGQDAVGAGLGDLDETLAATGAGLVEVALTRAPEQRVHIPWFERDFTVPQCLRQVLTHSINHRADINGWLPRFGVESADVDYIDLALADG